MNHDHMGPMEFPVLDDAYFESPLGKTHFRYIRTESDQFACILPGLTIPSAAYVTFARKLSEADYTVVTIDYFGRGFSEPSDKFDFSISGYTTQVLDLLAHLSVTTCVLISFSFGSLIAANIAERAPDLISRLVFFSPFHFLRKPIRSFQQFMLSNRLFGQTLIRLTSQYFITTGIGRQFSDLSQHEEAYWGTVGCCLHQGRVNRTFCDSLSRFLSSFSHESIADNMPKVTQMSVRTLVMLGEKDAMIDIVESRKWWEHWMPNVKVITQDDVGHLMFLEQPDGTSDVVLRFLQKPATA
jgi:pimeloyl-ACP methyl ester carboxylesterase